MLKQCHAPHRSIQNMHIEITFKLHFWSSRHDGNHQVHDAHVKKIFWNSWLLDSPNACAIPNSYLWPGCISNRLKGITYFEQNIKLHQNYMPQQSWRLPDLFLYNSCHSSRDINFINSRIKIGAKGKTASSISFES